MSFGRGKEVQSKTNWVKIEAGGLKVSSLHVGRTKAVVLRSSGNNLSNMPYVVLHSMRAC